MVKRDVTMAVATIAEATVPATNAVHERSGEEGRRLYLDNRQMIADLLQSVARRRWMTRDEADDFASMAYLRIMNDDYAILRSFHGRSSLRTFLTVVVQRLLLDFRAAQWGRWRSSRGARRCGEAAILLERLTVRDGLTFDEACAAIERHGLTVPRDELEQLHRQLRPRVRPMQVGEDALGDVPAHWGSADALVVASERSRLTASTAALLTRALDGLSDDDRLLIRLRFVDALSVTEIARLRKINPKALYGRLARLLRRLRGALERSGATRTEILALIGDGDVSLHVF